MLAMAILNQVEVYTIFCQLHTHYIHIRFLYVSILLYHLLFSFLFFSFLFFFGSFVLVLFFLKERRQREREGGREKRERERESSYLYCLVRALEKYVFKCVQTVIVIVLYTLQDTIFVTILYKGYSNSTDILFLIVKLCAKRYTL